MRLRLITENRIVKNFSVLFMSDALVSIVGILNMLMIINSIGSYNNGILLMVQTYVLLMSDIFNFQCFNGIVCYIPKFIKNRQQNSIKSYINQALLLELISGIVSFLVGQFLIASVANFMNWDSIIIIAVRFYLITNIINFTGTCTAVLRVFDEFKRISFINIIIVVLRMILYCIGFFRASNVNYFILAELLIDLTNKILNIVFMKKVLKKNNINKFFKLRCKFDNKFIKFNFYSNISQTIDIPVYHITTFIINKFLGFNEITIFKVIQKIGSVIEKLGKPLNQIVYPEISNYIAENDYKRVRKLSIRIFRVFSLIAIFASFILVITNNLWQTIFFDKVSISNLIVMIMYLVLLIFINSTTSIHAIFIALELVKYNIPIQLIVNTIYLVILVIFTVKFGLIGVIIARILQSLAITGIKSLILIKKKVLDIKYI